MLTDQTGVNAFTREQLLANIAMIITVALWGVSFVSIKIAVNEVPPITMALVRFSVASAILWVIIRKFEPSAKLQKKDVPRMLFAGCLGVTLYFFFENTGVKLTTASNASLIVTIIPILAIAMDKIFFRTKVSAIQLLGIGIAILGTYLAATANGEVDFTSATFRGNIFMVLAMFSWSLYTLINKSFHNKYSGLALTAYQMMMGTLCLIPLSFFEHAEWRLFSLTVLCHILFLSVFCSVVCYLLYMHALKKLDVTITTVYLNLVPVIGVVSGHLFLSENVLPIQMVGGLITLLAILMVNFEKYVSRGFMVGQHSCSAGNKPGKKF